MLHNRSVHWSVLGFSPAVPIRETNTIPPTLIPPACSLSTHIVRLTQFVQFSIGFVRMLLQFHFLLLKFKSITEGRHATDDTLCSSFD